MSKLKAFFAAALGGTSLAVGAEFSAAAKAVNELGVELHQRLSHGGENLCISPYSIQSALAMTYAGADGATQKEMAKVLHYPGSGAIHSSFGALQKALNQITAATTERAKKSKQWGGPSEPLVLEVANRLYGQKDYAFRASFQDMLRETYDAPLEQVNFAASAKTTKLINDWVEERTRNRIKDLIPQGVLNGGTRLVLVNAVYMKAPWAEEFHAGATKPAPFHIRGGETAPVPTMARKDNFGYAKRDGYQVVALPYIGGEVQFVVFVPDAPDGLANVEKKLTAGTLADCAKLDAPEVILHLPKFKLVSPSISLAKELQALGMKTAFDQPPGSANFDQMAPRAPGDYLFISEVLHKTFLALDEKGTEAAAATAVMMRAGSAAPREKPKPIEVKVDRPFLFAIQHRPSGACLFLGRVTDPR